MAEIIKELHGFSGSRIYLMQRGDKVFVRKIGNVSRNFERMTHLRGKVPIPNILNYQDETLDIEYIHGIDIKTYLLSSRPHLAIADFIIEHIEKFQATSVPEWEVESIFRANLAWYDYGSYQLPFNSDMLVSHLPKFLPWGSDYHGDMTLENILFSERDGFVFIDPVHVSYTSWVCDLAKLRQDLVCKWFIRREPNINIDIKLAEIHKRIFDKYPIGANKYLLIIMLLRVLRHTTSNTFERNFLNKEIIKLWR